MNIHIPDFIFNGHFWAGFGTCAAILIALFLFAMSNFNPFGR